MITAPDERPAVPPVALHVIRLALVLGPVVAAAVMWQLRRIADAETSGVVANQMYIGAIFLWLMALGALAAFRGQLARATTDGARAQTLIMAWAVGEAVALFGAVDYFLAGGWSWFIAGLALLIADAFLLFPVRRPA